jgi:hypothetical protein
MNWVNALMSDLIEFASSSFSATGSRFSSDSAIRCGVLGQFNRSACPLLPRLKSIAAHRPGSSEMALPLPDKRTDMEGSMEPEAWQHSLSKIMIGLTIY